MVDSKFYCESPDMPLLITFGDYNIYCETAQLPNSPPLFFKDTCYIEYNLSLNIIYIIGIVVVSLIFLPCIAGIFIYSGLIIYLKIKRRGRDTERSELLEDYSADNIY